MRLVLDWDGTVTVRDSLVQVIHEFGDAALLRELEARVGVDLTLHEEIALEFRAIRAPLDEVVAWVVEHIEVRDGLHELAERHRPLVISAGFHELIEPVLEREGVRLEVLANRVDATPEGWRVRFRDEAACATCGEPCKRGSLAGEPYVYAGDGYSDRCAALAAERVFARDGLRAISTCSASPTSRSSTCTTSPPRFAGNSFELPRTNSRYRPLIEPVRDRPLRLTSAADGADRGK